MNDELELLSLKMKLIYGNNPLFYFDERATLTAVSPDSVRNGVLKIPNGILTLGSVCFISVLDELEKVILPNSVKYIEHHCFSQCKKLKHVILSSNLVTLDDYAFKNCKSLESIKLPDSCIHIGYHCFYNCSSLSSVILSNNKSFSIGDEAFKNCFMLTNKELMRYVY